MKERLDRERERPLWAPNPGKDGRPSPQERALASPANVIGFGGAAGGGKSDLAIGLALTQHYKSIIFRREYKHLRDIIRRTKDLTRDVRTGFNANENILGLPGERTIEFGAMQLPDDWENYKGRPHDLKSYDEATEFTEVQVRSSMAWNRTTRQGQPCRILLTFNPPTNPEGQWVVRFFAAWLNPSHPRPAYPGELRWYAMVDGEEVEREDGHPFEHEGETLYPQSRTFFPAKLSDNPYHDNPEYRATLQALPEPLRSQLLYGDFEATAKPNPWQVIPTAWVEAAMERWKARRRPDRPMTCLGMDVAHGGDDQTVLAPRHGDFIDRLEKHPGKETPNGASAAVLAVKRLEVNAYINVDVIGYGASAHERLAERPPAGHGLKAYPINFAERSDYTDKSGKYRMVNKRAEAYWRLRDDLDPEGETLLALPPDPELKADLTAPTYSITTTGIKVESKDDIKARLGGRSPDCGDAVALAVLPRKVSGGPAIVGGQRPTITVR